MRLPPAIKVPVPEGLEGIDLIVWHMKLAEARGKHLTRQWPHIHAGGMLDPETYEMRMHVLAPSGRHLTFLWVMEDQDYVVLNTETHTTSPMDYATFL